MIHFLSCMRFGGRFWRITKCISFTFQTHTDSCLFMLNVNSFWASVCNFFMNQHKMYKIHIILKKIIHELQKRFYKSRVLHVCIKENSFGEISRWILFRKENWKHQKKIHTWRWLAILWRVRQSIPISSKILEGTALSTPSCSTACTNLLCNSGVQSTYTYPKKLSFIIFTNMPPSSPFISLPFPYKIKSIYTFSGKFIRHP